MREVNEIIIHCSATKGDVSAKQIDAWHKERGWRKIGYHFLIRSNGDIQQGRLLEEVGAHCKGHNKHSIGVCLAGGLDGTPNYTNQQWTALRVLCKGLDAHFGGLEVSGHNNYTNAKACPCFDVKAWWSEQ